MHLFDRLEDWLHLHARSGVYLVDTSFLYEMTARIATCGFLHELSIVLGIMKSSQR